MFAKILLAVVIGWVVGIVVNLLADVLPLRKKFKLPACPQCEQGRSVLARSGLAAYLSGQRRCPACETKLPIRYLFVELGMIAVYVLCWLRGGPPLALISNLFYGTVFVLVLTTDLEHRLIPHAIMLPSIAIAIVLAFVDPVIAPPAKGLLGGGIGLIFALGLYWFGKLFAKMLGKARGKEIKEVAFGFGDVTLITFIGLAVGVPEIFLALVIGLFSGGIGAGAFLLVRGLVQKRYTLFTAIPYGPFLILGGVVMRYFGVAIMLWYLGPPPV